MYSAISGMKVNQVKLDVTGNNISNVGTTAFKGSRVRFQDMLSQNVSQALGPGRNTGGVNPRQVGLGVQVSGIDTIVSQGMMQPTSRNLDVAMDGTGYFVVARGPLPESNSGGIGVDQTNHTMRGGNLEVSFTRDGSFTLDHQGNLLTSDGYRVMGYALKEKDGTNKDALSIDYDANGYVNFVDSDSEYGLINSGNLVPLRIPDSVHVRADNISTDKDGMEMVYVGSGDKKAITTTPKVNTNGAKFEGKTDLKIQIRYVDTDGDPATEMDARIFINGEQLLNDKGDKVGFVTALTKTEIEAHIKGKLGYDKIPDTDPDKATKQAEIEKKAKEETIKIIGNSTINIKAPAVDATADKSKYEWSFNVRAEGDKKIRSFSIEKDGILKAVLDDGTVSALGQIGMASFKNPAGLTKLGKNMLQNSANSGEPIVRSGIGSDPAYDNGDGYGDMLQGMLEMSNIDLAEQFTDMIVTTRAFQAAGKMISTGDEILQDIINLKR
ncbi:flagellar hook-basal body complex protein [Clostridium sp. MB40-C1]|uniref:flagellar hook-basal body complex protein n=1 Tax=Clostridium sp. MB40-C1 TaxID=3070996 RepID=UPI0027DFB824|nr:flagellar hook-basal body complex protein [Clostridium sp. MB40-C1]WMJ82406.1 flagellar hook-basal body complex protein [Clostridium sp. MB40-C1]